MLQVILFFVIYGLTITQLRESWGGSLSIVIFYAINFNEIIYVFFLLIATDLIAYLVACSVEIVYDYKKDFVRRQKTKFAVGRRAYEYFFYTGFRTIFFAIGFIWLLTAALYPTMQGGAFFTAWVLTSVLSKLPSKLLAIKMSL